MPFSFRSPFKRRSAPAGGAAVRGDGGGGPICGGSARRREEPRPEGKAAGARGFPVLIISEPSALSPRVVIRAEAGDSVADLTSRARESLDAQRRQPAAIGEPAPLRHHVHVRVDPSAPLGLRGLPKDMHHRLREAGFTRDEIAGSLPDLLACVGCHDRMLCPPMLGSMRDGPVRTKVRRYKLNELLSHGDPSRLYRDMVKLDSGSQGDVYRAREARDGGQAVALKRVFIKDEATELPALENEISMLYCCRHPNIVEFRACYRHHGALWIAMELMNGGKLTDLIEDGHQFKEREISYLLREVLRGVQYLHTTGRVHRDIKSDNVLLSTSGQVKLADFGFCAMLSEGRNAKRKTVVGTPYWMAPEVIRADPYDAKADCWSLGILGIELCDGEPPHMTLPPMRALYVIVTQRAPRVRSRDRRSRDCVDFIESTLSKEPALRPSVADLLAHPFMRRANDAEPGFLRTALCRV